MNPEYYKHDQVFYIASNFFKPDNKENEPVAKKQKSDNLQVIYNNQRYWWKFDNKNGSKRYVCVHQDLCPASITIKNNQVIRKGENHINHLPLTNHEVLMYIAEQKLKQKVI